MIATTASHAHGVTHRLAALGAPGLLGLVVIALSACSAGGDRPQLDLPRASIVTQAGGVALNLDLRFRPSTVQLDAMDHGVPLNFTIRVMGDGGAPAVSTGIGLRYFPLSRRYQLHLGAGDDRSFALRGYLLDALQRLSLPLPHDPCPGSGACRVEARLDYSRLPGALRLPALLRPAWHVPVATATVSRP
ncbi:MAG: DUF4390 domain-containing protein [Rhodanobacteraceae bacterium]